MDYGCESRGRCAACPDHTKRCVATDGPASATILFLGEAPGREEDAGGRPFIGKAGGEFNHNYLKLAGLERNQIRISNSTRCRPENNKKPSDALRRVCSLHHLAPELEEYGDQLQLIVPMGAVACGLFEPRVDLAVHHGFPVTRQLFGRHYTVFPVYHPAAGLHSSGMLAPLVRDFERLGEWLRGELELPRYEFKGKERYAAVRGDEVRQIMARGIVVPPAIDTEHVKRSGRKVLWSSQFSIEPGTGWLIWADDRIGMQHLVDAANTHGYTMHYSTEDWEELRRNGWVLRDDHGWFNDTIQVAFVQAIHSGGASGSEEAGGGMWGGLGLKNLAWRMCGIEMRSYQELVWGASKRAVLRWLGNAKSVVPERAVVTPPRYSYSAGELVKVLRGVERHVMTSKRPDPWKSWARAQQKILAGDDGQVIDDLNTIRECFGDMPYTDLGSVLEWLALAQEVVPSKVKIRPAKVDYDPGRFVTVLNRLQRYTLESDDYDPWEKWDEAVAKVDAMEDGPEKDEMQEALVMIAEHCGPIPEEGIDKAPRDEAIRYACEDANATGMLRLALEKEGEKLERLRRVDRKDWVS